MEPKKANGGNIYYISAFYWRNYNAASKAKMDIEETFKRKNFQAIEFFKNSRNGSVRLLSLRKLLHLLLFDNKTRYENSIVFFQSGTGVDLIISLAIKKIFRNSKRVIMIHDVESLRLGKINIPRERIVFSNFTHAICASEAMAQFLKDNLGFKGKIYTYGLLDYLVEDEKYESLSKTIEFPSLQEKFKIIYAGNLGGWKASFIYKFVQQMNPSKFVINLYGKGYQGPTKDNVLEFKGAFPPDELLAKIDGHFGLVWDGEDISQPSGLTGKYLQYNSPHKASLYIVSGLPLIVWKGAAVYKLVEQYKIGFGIDSLLELDERLKEITPEQYSTWKANISNLAKELANGQSLGRVIDQILSE
ncbi:MAG TPA: hypothetical protein PL174_01895 [Fervidobacterium sp.]|nr:hypothetical protein [Fervidobacterium sp.]